MKDLKNFYTDYITEGRPPGSKNKPKEWPNDPKKLAQEPEVKNAVSADDVDTKAAKSQSNAKSNVTPGKSAEDNGTRKLWAVDAPEPNWEAELAKLNIDELDDNAYELSERFDDKHDFLVIGEAGWAKTSLIEEMAKKHGYTILTIYLNYAVASDLNGIPVATELKGSDRIYMNYSLPGWVLYMLDHPKDKFLVFFDEINQAQPDVLNGLMPIVLEHVICGIKFDNIIIGAAGNESFENDSLNTINKPLLSRFKPVIKWEVHTKATWKPVFEWMHKKFDKEVGKDIINKLSDLQDYWECPRDITRVLLEFIKANKGREGRKYSRASSIFNKLSQCVWEKADANSRVFEKEGKELAESISQYIQSDSKAGEKEEESDRKSSKGMDNVNEGSKNALIKSLKNGYFYFSKDNGGDNGKYLCTLDNCITALFPPDVTGITAEVLRKIVRDMEASGDEVKYKTVEDGKKDAFANGWTVLVDKDGQTCEMDKDGKLTPLE